MVDKAIDSVSSESYKEKTASNIIITLKKWKISLRSDKYVNVLYTAHSCRLLQLSHIKRKQLQQADFQEMSDEYVNVLMDKYVNVLHRNDCL